MHPLILFVALAGVPAARGAVAPSRAAPRLEIDDRGRPEERALLEGMIADVLRSTTCREAAGPYLSPGPALAKVELYDFRDPAESGYAGIEDGSTRPMTLRISEKALAEGATEYDEVLAHEWLGHARVDHFLGARGLPLPPDVSEGEMLARLYGFIAALELGREPTDWDTLRALSESTAAYRAGRRADEERSMMPWMSREESADPRRAILAGLRRLSSERDTDAAFPANSRVWHRWLAHLILVHGAPEAAFEERLADIDGWEAKAPENERDRREKESVLWKKYEWFATPEGRAHAAKLKRIARGELWPWIDDQMTRLRPRLAALLAAYDAAHPAPANPPAPTVAQLSWDDITARCSQDRAEHPEHWKDVPEDELPVLPENGPPLKASAP